MEEEVQQETAAAVEAPKQEPVQPETPKQEAPRAEAPKPEAPKQDAPKPGQRREDRPPRPPQENRGENRAEARKGDDRGTRGGPDRRPDRGGDRGGDRREGPRPGGGRPFEMAPEIELEKLISDSLYLDNQAHAVVARMRDMDSGTKSQLRRLYNAVRRAVRAPESERQHQFVMLRARLAYTIARHSLRSLDALERLLLQVTRRNDARGYERFKDLFEAIVAYNE
ncbi:MAG TPA: type III-A CRISPR-associated protein Csm2 [Bryobacteraceae bacterium]|nr:type III-A CRISPR-associated protein Csm2 [Bryobacteraceae bacterium]